jgi:hypothetical protein
MRSTVAHTLAFARVCYVTDREIDLSHQHYLFIVVQISFHKLHFFQPSAVPERTFLLLPDFQKLRFSFPSSA